MRATVFLLFLILGSTAGLGQDALEVGPGQLSLARKSYKALEGNKENISVIRSGGSSGEVRVHLKWVGGSATVDEDFTNPDQELVFADGEAEKVVTIAIAKDQKLEWPETIRLALEAPEGGATLLGNTETTLQIVMIRNDAVVTGLLFAILAFVFSTASSASPRWKTFYKFVPSLLLCYFLPSLLSTLGVFGDHDHSSLYAVASRYLLPACLVLLCLSIDLPGLKKLGPKALIMFLTGTAGIVIGGPLAYFIMSKISPETLSGTGANAVWRGMTTIAGSWIGGGANQAAMKEFFHVGGQIFSSMVTVDIIVANLWMAVLLFLAGESDAVDKWLGADNSAIKEIQAKMERHQEKIAKNPTLSDTMKIVGVAFAITGVGHFIGDLLGPFITANYPKLVQFSLNSSFFWVVVIASFGGLFLSFTKAREWEGLGASRLGSAFLYFLVATIGMEMDLRAVFHYPGLFLVGAIWITFHGLLLLIVAKLIKAPLFFLAIGSQANVGGAASAPIMASAFHPTLAPVGVMLAVMGYFIGTFGGLVCGWILQAMAGA